MSDSPQNSDAKIWKRRAKASAVFASALLFGNKVVGSKGLLHTLSSATGAATVGAVGFLFRSERQRDMEAALRNHEAYLGQRNDRKVSS
ncbi:hypothetical protein [Vreelandella olivaria]|uniref:hypothetical protein n=1 Tax=Vreelandella olivaria TaxID=390919 RepID=UPI00201F38E1|nr:hypothetical protein [Halomonas olivaria]